MQCTIKEKGFKIVKDIAITDHDGINKTSSTPTTLSSIPTPNNLPPPITTG
jgi:DNA-binding winged helix-turn-helix (wHTH) protein